MIRIIAILLAFAVFLSGCQGLKYAMDNYDGVEVRHFTLAGSQPQPGQPAARSETFRIFDKPHESRLMITPSMGAIAGMGTVSGLTFGSVSGRGSPARMREASMAFLYSTGRTCAVDSVDLVVAPQYEARYRCAAARVNPASETATTATARP